MKICIAGKNNIAVEIVLYLLEIGIEKNNIYIIPNQTDKAEDNWQRSLLRLAKIEKLKIYSLEDVYNIKNLIFLSLEFDKIIRPSEFKTNQLFNIHFSLLPQYKGMFTSIMPILYNERYTGVTLHKIDKGIDTGEIIEQSKIKIEYNDNSRSLYLKYISYGTELIKKNLLNLIENNHQIKTKQNSLNSSYFSKKSINFSNIEINLNQTSINIHNQIRAYNFREYQIPTIFGTSIIGSKILSTSSNQKVGTVIFENDISCVLSTIDYDIVIYKDRVDELFEACKNGRIEIVNKLIQIPQIINTQNAKGWTPLIVAIYNNRKDIVKTLLINGADVNISNFKGTSTLMYAKSSYVIHEDDEIIKLILSLDVDIYQKDYENKNIIDYCIENSENRVLRIIKESVI
jgi:methionyl-tRNA formyltransferase